MWKEVQTTHVFNQADQSGNWQLAAALRRPSCCLATFNPFAYINPCKLHTRRNGRLFLAIAGLLVVGCLDTTCCCDIVRSGMEFAPTRWRALRWRTVSTGRRRCAWCQTVLRSAPNAAPGSLPTSKAASTPSVPLARSVSSNDQFTLRLLYSS